MTYSRTKYSSGFRSNAVPAVKDPLKWVSCSQDAEWATSRHRHLLANALDTLCNASASYAEVWRGNSTKPKCDVCLGVAKARGLL